MAEETNEEEVKEKKGGLVGKLIIPMVLLLAVGAGLGVYFGIIAPRLAPEEGMEDLPEIEVADIPAQPVPFVLEDNYVNVLREGTNPASTLIFGVTLECNGTATSSIVELYATRFVDIVNSLHDSRTRDELDDMLEFKNSVREQAMQKMNDLLVKIQGEDVQEDIRITDIIHRKCMVQDQV